MTGPEFDAILDALGWSRRHVAGLLGCSEALPWRWATGRLEVPPAIAQWLRALATSHALHPVPSGWRRRAA